MALENLEYYQWQKIIMRMKDGINQNKLSLEIGMTYSHISKLLHILKDKGFITMELSGRQSVINLTLEGKQLQSILLQANEITKNVTLKVEQV